MFLNVGGAFFKTTQETLASSSFFASLLATHPESDEFFIDRDPTHFRFILNWLRNVRYVPDDEMILQELVWECDYYCMHDMRDFIQRKKHRYHINRALHCLSTDVRQLIPQNDITAKATKPKKTA